ncbi:MAG: succinate--CoA ligase subunit beta, partial [Acidobacteria bacterium]|nr:succinate--CoA ligase subunit beta [Acidobacteriota bacterium]
GILRCDLLAQGVADAVGTAGVMVPVIVRMEGTNVAEGRRILTDSNFDFIVAEGMQDAATKAVAAAREQS